MLFPEHLTCEVRQGLIIHQEERPNLPLLQKISGCCQGCEDFIFSNVEAQFRQPLQQVSLALFRCVGHKLNRNRSAAQPDGWRAKSLLPRTTSHLHTSYGFWRLKNECLSKGCRWKNCLHPKLLVPSSEETRLLGSMQNGGQCETDGKSYSYLAQDQDIPALFLPGKGWRKMVILNSILTAVSSTSTINCK